MCVARVGNEKSEGTGLVFLAEEGETEMTTVFIRNKYNKAIENALELPAWVWGGVSDLSRLQGVSPSTVMKRAISAYIARYYKHSIVCSKLGSETLRCA